MQTLFLETKPECCSQKVSYNVNFAWLPDDATKKKPVAVAMSEFIHYH